MARRQRLAAQAAAASLRNSTPLIPALTDNEMTDPPPVGITTPRDYDDETNRDQEDAEAEGLEDRPITPSRDSETPSRSATPRRSGRSTSLLPRKRRMGRPPKNRQAGSDDDRNDVPSDTGTPRRRGGFRGHRGGRWAKRVGGPSHVTQVPIDKEGNMMDVVDDEVEMAEDPEGEKKVDKLGYLQDGREYRVRTFTILGRGKRLYMLSTEPARCIGFRDSYLFFQKHRLLYKIIIDDEEKRDLIERSLIPHSYKGRAIGVVTARSVFREFGARIVIGGRKVIDDYAVQAARAQGDVEGELAVPDDRLPLPGEPYNRNQYVAWHGASAVYHSGVPSTPLPTSGKIIDGKKRKATVTSDNWMLEHAREASRFNATLTAARREINGGHYDIHTNTVQWPSAMQPTHTRWESVEDDKVDEEEDTQRRLADGINTAERNTDQRQSPTSHKLDPIYPRNFMIHDLVLEGAPESRLGPPGLAFDPQSLTSVPENILDELPPDCRQGFEVARRVEMSWRSRWNTETTDGHRGIFTPTVEWFA